MANIEMRHLSPGRRSEERQALLMMIAVYPFCLVAAGFARFTKRPPSAARRSVFSEAHASAAACIPFAFR